MKVTHVNYWATYGGASLAALRLHKGLRKAGVDSEMLVRWKQSSTPKVRALRCRTGIRGKIDRWLDRRKEKSLYGLAKSHGIEKLSDASAYYTDDLFMNIPEDTDVLHLHWVSGLVDYNEFLRAASKRWPIVWTLHDLNPILGVTHFPESAFPEAPVGCKQPDGIHAWSQQVIEMKAKAYEGIEASRLTFACPCSWAHDQVKSSPLLQKFASKVMHYGVRTDIFQPFDKATARVFLGLEKDAFVVATNALDLKHARKGLQLLVEALEGSPPDWRLLILGSPPTTDLAELPVPAIGAGRLVHGVKVAAAMAAADVLVLPSLCETGPATVMEAMACGLPVIATSVGDVPEMITSSSHGYCIEPDPEKIREKLDELYHNPDIRDSVAKCARPKIISTHGAQREVSDYIKLYHEVIDR